MSLQIKVRLTTDLTRYHPALTVGAEGVTIGQVGEWSRGSDLFVSVRFELAGVHDILWKSLEITDEAFLREQAARERAWREALRAATDIVKTVGPKGGFRSLSYRYTDATGMERHGFAGDRQEAQRAEALFLEYGLPIVVKVEPGRS